jgi:small ligand-binding sensory domain FIST
MRFGVALSTAVDTGQAVEQVAERLGAVLDGAAPDLVMLFVSHHHADEFDGLAARVRAASGARHLIGASGESILGEDREVERQPALCVWAAEMPEVELNVFTTGCQRTPEGAAFTDWPAGLDRLNVSDHAVVLLAEPFSFDTEAFLARLDEDHGGLRAIGGMASGGTRPGENVLFFGDDVVRQGAVGVAMGGDVHLEAVVSQGCRPVGEYLRVTEAQQNIILKLGGRPALEKLKELMEGLNDRDREVFQNGPHLGRVINEYQDSFGRGDFLVRNLIGIDPQHGAIAVGDLIRPGQTVQFHARDADAADEDLRAMLEGRSAEAALLFTCNGRGTRLFDERNHDISVLHDQLGDIPTAGFFAAGEIGPVGSRNFLHGFTATMLLFQSAAAAS